MAKGAFSHLSLHYPHYHKDCNLFPRKPASFLLWLLAASLFFFLSFLSSARLSRVSIHQRDNPSQLDHDSSTISINDDLECDLFDGKWVRDFRGPAYTNLTCRTLPESKNCRKYGKNQDFLNWRWKPKKCELPRFDATGFLEMVRGKRMAFVGDSVARNQMESLLCILSQVETPFDVESDEEDRFRTWYFSSYDFTFMIWWTKFLAIATERVINGSSSGVYDLHLDKVDPSWTDNLPHADYLVISNGHWFFRKLYLYENGRVVGCVFCSEANVADLGISFAIRRAFRTALEHVNQCEGCDGMVTLVRTFSPAHFQNGAWDSGGYCNRTRPLRRRDLTQGGFDWEIRKAQVEEVMRMMSGGRRRGTRWFGALDVTKAMAMRPDAHPNSHWNNNWNKGFNDCVHWCLPGPIDMWNDLLFEVLRRED